MSSKDKTNAWPAETDPVDADPKIDAPPEEKADAASRARSCAGEIEQVLRRWNCRILAQIHPAEPVGWAGDRVQISASYGIVPNPDQPQGG